MKRLFVVLMLVLMLMPIMFVVAEAVEAVPVVPVMVVVVEAEVFGWAQLATIAGATAAVLLIVQYVKLPIDKVWKIPTRAVVYVLSLLIVAGAKYFINGATFGDVPLIALNAYIVASSAMGTYELTFKKLEENALPV